MAGNNRIIVIGASGMLGNALLRFFSEKKEFEVYGTLRHSSLVPALRQMAPLAHLLPGVDAENLYSLNRIFSDVKPNIVINCVGIVKQLSSIDDHLISLPINALFPHRLYTLARLIEARFVHISTDCVFSGDKGSYVEADYPDAKDLYGRSKLLGEVIHRDAITIRTSIIGHELTRPHSLIEWFLSQTGEVKGYKNAIFSGLPAVEIARIIHDFVIPNPELSGLYHLSANPISKYDLLTLVAKVYGKDIRILPDYDYVIDRSLNSDLFRSSSGYKPECWEEMISRMHSFR